MNITERIEAARKPPEREEPAHRVITIRMSCDRHKALKTLSEREKLSMNTLALIALETLESELNQENDQCQR